MHLLLNRGVIPATRTTRTLDGNCADDLTLIPWREGRYLTWDVTLANTTAAFYLTATATVAGSAAVSMAVRKKTNT